MDYTLFDGIALGDLLSDVTAPKPFRLFKTGENLLTQNGKDYRLTLSAANLNAIAEYNAKKGEKIPIDSRHALLLAAEKANISEAEALKAVPSGISALGFAKLELQGDGLYATDIELMPLAAELFKAGSLRYWSPVIRGLDGKSPLRVTSIAMDNVPALNKLEILAASAEQIKTSDLSDTKRKDTAMTKTEIALRKLLGDASLALSDDTDALTAAKLETLAEELPGLRSKAAECDKLALAAETAQKKELIDKAVAENRVTNAEREGLLGLSVAWLAAELPKRPPNAVPNKKLPEGDDDQETMTDNEKKVAEKMGLSAEEFLKSRKGCAK